MEAETLCSTNIKLLENLIQLNAKPITNDGMDSEQKITYLIQDAESESDTEQNPFNSNSKVIDADTIEDLMERVLSKCMICSETVQPEENYY